MSVEVTRLCLRPLGGDRPHAASGIGLARRLDRRRQPQRRARRARHFASARAHGVQGHQAAHRAPDRRGDRGGRRRSQRRHQHRNRPPITRACSRPTCRWRSTCCPTSSAEPTFDADELRREQNVIVQEIGAVEDAPDDLVFDRLQETAFPKQAVGRSILGTPETVRSFNPARLRSYLSRTLSRARHDRGRRRRGRPCRDRRRRRKALRELRRSRRAGAGARAFPRRHAGSRRATSSRCTSRWRCKACRCATSSCTACRSSPTCSAAACPRACSRKCARSAASATPSAPSTCPIATPACSRFMPAPTKPTRPN